MKSDVCCRIEIAVVDTTTASIQRFGQDKEHEKRILLFYDGLHYDPLVREFLDDETMDADAWSPLPAGEQDVSGVPGGPAEVSAGVDAPRKRVQYVFSTGDDIALGQALELASEARSTRQPCSVEDALRHEEQSWHLVYVLRHNPLLFIYPSYC